MDVSLPRRALWSARAALAGGREARLPFAPPQKLARIRRARLRAVLVHAQAHVPYYAETMSGLGLTAADFRDVEDLAKLPLIERAQLQADPEYFTSRRRPIDHYLAIPTGGSTAEPVIVFRDSVEIAQRVAIRERWMRPLRELTGKGRRYRDAGIFPPSGLPAGEDGPPEPPSDADASAVAIVPSWYRGPRLELSIADPPSLNLERLNRFKPDAIFAYGSYLEGLFAYIDRSGEDFHRPKVVFYSSDGLSQPARRLISEGFGIPIITTYSSSEAPMIAFGCSEGLGLHLNSDVAPMRLVDAEGRDADLEVPGEVVVSNLLARGTVLLNYRLGDMAARLPRACPCGRTFPLLSFVEGRANEWLESPTGEPFHSQTIRMFMRHEPGILRYQLTQHARTAYELAIVAASDCERGPTEERLRSAFGRWLGAGSEVRILWVDDLPRTRAGKTRNFVTIAEARRLDAVGGSG